MRLQHARKGSVKCVLTLLYTSLNLQLILQLSSELVLLQHKPEDTSGYSPTMAPITIRLASLQKSRRAA